jgi:hypothetical protein
MRLIRRLFARRRPTIFTRALAVHVIATTASAGGALR